MTQHPIPSDSPLRDRKGYMVRISILFSFIFVSLNSFAISEVKILKTSEGEFQFEHFNNSWVSKSCKTSSCLALMLVRTKLSHVDKSGKWTKQPAAEFCLSNEGKYLVGNYSDDSQDGLCLFKDKSFILGWDYYYRHHPK